MTRQRRAAQRQSKKTGGGHWPGFYARRHAAMPHTEAGRILTIALAWQSAFFLVGSRGGNCAAVRSLSSKWRRVQWAWRESDEPTLRGLPLAGTAADTGVMTPITSTGKSLRSPQCSGSSSEFICAHKPSAALGKVPIAHETDHQDIHCHGKASLGEHSN